MNKHTTPGVYQHFKGPHYRVLFVAQDSETYERLVVYVPLYGAGIPTIRSEVTFHEEVEQDDYKGPRFRWVTY